MSDPLTAAERGWLLDAIAELVAAGGARTFLQARMLEPTPADFPDPFEPGEAGVRALLRRLLGHVGLGALEVDLDTFSQPDVVRELDERGEARKWGHEGAAAWFAGIDARGCCHFGIAEERLGDEGTKLVATLCHEVAHAWRAVQGLAAGDRDVEERVTDVTTVYLGFGVLTTNGAYVYRQGGEYSGTQAFTRWSHARAGYLPPEAMSFLLAAQVKARGLGWLARRRVSGRLETNQAAWFRAAYRALPGTEALRGALGIAGAGPS